MTELFREQAVQNQRTRMLGRVLLSQPVSHWWMSGITTAFVTALCIFLVTGSYARKARVSGVLVPDRGIIKIYTGEIGTITRIHAGKGDFVKKGAPLITLYLGVGLEGGRSVDALLLAQIAEQKAGIRTRLQLHEQNADALAERQEKRIVSLRSSVTRLEQQRKLQKERLDLHSSRLQSLADLVRRGDVSRDDYFSGREAWLEHQQKLLALDQQLEESRSRLSEAIYRQAQARIEAQDQQNRLRHQLSDSTQREVEITGRRSHVIVSPVTGMISSLDSAPGQTTVPGLSLVSILPQDSRLQANLFVPSRAAGFLRTGQAVRIRYDAFPWQRYGIHSGRIISLTRNILKPGELTAPLPVTEPVYKITVQLDTQSIENGHDRWPLQAGMMLEADILLERQSLGRWLLDPMYRLRGKLSS